MAARIPLFYRPFTVAAKLKLLASGVGLLEIRRVFEIAGDEITGTIDDMTPADAVPGSLLPADVAPTAIFNGQLIAALVAFFSSASGQEILSALVQLLLSFLKVPA